MRAYPSMSAHLPASVRLAADARLVPTACLAARARLAALLLVCLVGTQCALGAEPIVVGSKIFTESYILGELAAQTLESSSSIPVNRKLGMGNTGILFESLRSGAIDVYPDYTGTLTEAILKDPRLKTLEAIQSAMARQGLVISGPLGFDNTYALAVKESFAAQYGLNTVSDLARVQSRLRAGFSYEFMDREDGFRGLSARYSLALDPKKVNRMEHSLSYQAIDQNAVDVIDVYSTDAKIRKFGLRVLKDDRGYFPSYQAVWVARKAFVEKYPRQWQALRRYEGAIDASRMLDMNAEADLQKKSFAAIAAEFRASEAAKERGDPATRGERSAEGASQAAHGQGGQAARDESGQSARGEGDQAAPRESSRAMPGESLLGGIARRTGEHLWLVSISLLFSLAVGIPLGIISARFRAPGQVILLMSALIQTVPSLALLCFLIPVFGVGTKPALVALCFYSLLPVVINTFTGIRSINARHLENARAFGLNRAQTLFRIELPLASPMMLAGIKTATIVSIGTATLAALIGAGGYGAPIVSGLALNDVPTILTGAIPAALMAWLAHGLFEWLGTVLIPAGLQKRT